MNYTGLALKWRPKDFEGVLGQAHITESLKNAILKNKLAVAYLFSGPRGIGKTSTARILAKALNCLHGPTIKPCQKCSNCIEINEGRSLDVIEIDGASNRGIDEVRALRENVKFPPTKSKFKIYIIDEVHMLTEPAFNALLKTLEEPPHFIRFIFATTHPDKIIPTILSRCQHFPFKRIPLVEMAEYLEKIAKEEDIQIDKDVLFAISQASEGSVRDALVLLDQVSTYAKERVSLKEITSLLGIIDKKTFFHITQRIIHKDIAGLLKLIDQLIGEGKNPEDLLSGLIAHFRNLMVIKVMRSHTELIDLPKEDQKELFSQSQNFSMQELLSIFNTLVATVEIAKRVGSWRIILEVNLSKLAYEKKSSIQGSIKSVSCISGTSAEPESQENKSSTTEKNLDSKEISQENLECTSSMDNSQLTLEVIRNRWEELISRLSKIKMFLAQFLNEASLVKLESNKLILSFPKNLSLHKESLEKSQNRQIIEKLFYELFGVNLRVEFILSEEEKKFSPELQKPIDDPIKSALEAFNARLIN